MIIVPFRTGLSWSKDKHKTRLQNALNFLDFLGPYSNTANSRVLACLTKHTSPSRTPYICRAGRRSSVNWSNPCGSVMYVIFNSYLPMHCKNALILYQFGCFWKWMKMKICPKIVCLQWTLVWIYEGKKNVRTLECSQFKEYGIRNVPCIHEANDFSWVGQFQDPKDDSTTSEFVPQVPGALPRSNRNQ